MQLSPIPPMPKEASHNLAPIQIQADTPSIPIKVPVCLVAIDGWGISPNPGEVGDAIHAASTPVMDDLAMNHTYTTLAAHGLAVGLPDGLMGNSEVGHLNIGAGRVVYQDIVRIDLSVKKNLIGTLPAIKNAFVRAINGNGRLHLLGLVSDGGVHSHQNHLYALLSAARLAGVPKTYIHFIGDGRDTSPKSAPGFLRSLFDFIQNKNQGYGTLATICGRYYAMDRDKRWERVTEALNGYLHTQGERVAANTLESVVQAVNKRYDLGETDEFLKPLIIDVEGTFKDHDTVFCFNYRSDRMRQLCASLDPQCHLSPIASTIGVPKDLQVSTMTQYKADFTFPVAFPAQTMDNCLSEVLAKYNLRQSHIAETEKYAHVTFFFNGGVETQFAGEDRVLIPSPKVATYDLQPSMSAMAVGDAVAATIATQKYPFVMCNFAPPDMVGHTGKYEPAIVAASATDTAIGTILNACKVNKYALIVTSDHGNCEKMVDVSTGQPHTAHTTARVPLAIYYPPECGSLQLTKACAESALCDVAPTILTLMGLPVPEQMDGACLV